MLYYNSRVLLRFMRRRTRLLFYMLVAVTVLMSCITEGNEPTDGLKLKPGDRVPSFSVALNDGSIFSTDDLKEQRTRIVFFNTSCKDCQQELLSISEDDEVADMTVCIAREELEESIKAFWSEHSLTFLYSAQKDRVIYNLFATVGIPRVIIISSDGIILSIR